MKKTILPFISFLFLLSTLQAQNDQKKGIIFQSLTFEQATAKAKSENKMVFMHGFATWCHYCEFMLDSVYTNKEVGDYYNSNFICIKFDMEKEGVDIARKLKASSYPQLVFFDGDGNIVHRMTGQRLKDPFLQLGKDAQDPVKQMRTYELKFKNRTMNNDEAMIYFRQLAAAAVEFQPYVDNYLMHVPDSSFTSPGTWRVINEYLREVEMPSMARLIKNRNEFSDKYTADSVDNRIINNYNASLMMLVQKLDTNSYISLIQKLKASNLDLKDKIIAYAELNKNKVKSNWPKYIELAVPFVENYCKDDSRRLNEIAYTFYERAQAKDMFEKAESWSKEAIRLNDNYRYNHTLACLSYKLGKKDQALTAAKHALALGAKIGVDMKQTNLLIDKIKEL